VKDDLAPSSTAPDPYFDRTTVVLLALIFGIAAFATDMYLPAFPSIRETFDTTPRTVQLSLSLFLYGNAAGHLLFGPLSDRYGRKPVLACGLAAYAIASFGCALAANVNYFLAFRLAEGTAAASGPVLLRALINDRLERERAARMLALLTGMMALAAMLTPSLGGWLVQYRPWQWLFYGLGVTGVLLLGFTLGRLHETLPPERRLARLSASEIVHGYLDILRSLRFWSYVLPPSFMFAGVFAYAVVNSFLLIDALGMPAQHYGITYSIAACAYVAGSLTSHRLVRITGINRAIVIGLTLGICAAFAAVCASFMLPMSIPLVLVPGLAMFFSTSLILPIGFSVSVSLFPKRGGSASAVAGCTQLVFAAFSSGIAAYLYDNTTLPLHAFTLACCIAAVIAWVAGSRLRI